MGAGQRRKGAVYERKVSSMLRDWGWGDAERQWQQKRITDCGDVHFQVGDLRCMVECKNHQKVTYGTLCNWLEQAHGYEQAANDIGIVCYHVHGTSLDRALLEFGDLSRLLHAAYAAGVSAGRESAQSEAA